MKNLLSAALIIISISVNAQVIVKGTITDKNGSLLIGANVIIKGTYDETVIDSIGSYYLTVNTENPTLIATFIGYSNQELPVNSAKGTIEVNFKLKEQ